MLVLQSDITGSADGLKSDAGSQTDAVAGEEWDARGSGVSKIIKHRGRDALSLLWPLAYLGPARAAALQGDVAKREYERLK